MSCAEHLRETGFDSVRELNWSLRMVLCTGTGIGLIRDHECDGDSNLNNRISSIFMPDAGGPKAPTTRDQIMRNYTDCLGEVVRVQTSVSTQAAYLGTSNRYVLIWDSESD